MTDEVIVGSIALLELLYDVLIRFSLLYCYADIETHL